MMLQNELYRISGQRADEATATFVLELNALHPIYQAHFPGQPITPGVVIMEICRELMASHFGRETRLTGAKNVKFLAPLSPVEHPQVEFAVSRVKQDGSAVTATWTVGDGGTMMSRLSLLFEC